MAINIQVELIYCGQQQQFRETVTVAAGSSVLAIIEQSSLLQACPELPVVSELPIGMYGVRKKMTDTLVNDGRIEIYRSLKQDPKDRRRQLL